MIGVKLSEEIRDSDRNLNTCGIAATQAPKHIYPTALSCDTLSANQRSHLQGVYTAINHGFGA